LVDKVTLTNYKHLQHSVEVNPWADFVIIFVIGDLKAWKTQTD